MPSPTPPSQRLEQLFRRRKCRMLHQLARALDYAQISVRRFLKQIGYFRSYTHNGKWYTLRDAPDFDREGLWHFRGIGFSKHGNLTATIDYLLARSTAGLSASELTQKLQHPCHAVLSRPARSRSRGSTSTGRPVSIPRPRPGTQSPTAPASSLRSAARPNPLVKHSGRPLGLSGIYQGSRTEL